MLVIKKFIFNPFSENTYIIWDEETNEGMIVDPGCSDDSEETVLVNFIDTRNIFIKYLTITHCHVDHILGCKFVKKKYSPFFLVPKDDLPLLEEAKTQASAFGLNIEIPPPPDDFLHENSDICLGSTKVKIMSTPGHSPGEHCLYFEKEKFCVTGDVLFKNSIGRTDLWRGNYSILMESIKDKLLTLPDDVVIYPGHGESSEIGIEKNANPFLQN